MLDKLAALAAIVAASPEAHVIVVGIIADLALKLRPSLAALCLRYHFLAYIRDGVAFLWPRVAPAAISFGKAALMKKHPDVVRYLEIVAKAEAGK